jgi:5-methylcytosine-specific restriction endonuclease McrA
MNQQELNIMRSLGNQSTGSHLDRYKILQLNADFQPISYCPLSTLTWQQVMFLMVKGMSTGIPRLQVVEEYDDVWVNTTKMKIRLPSVVAHLEYITPPNKVQFTKFNIFLRDEFTCQYSGEKCNPRDLTFDHVIPKSRGGKTTWENIVTASRKINELKDDRTPKEANLTLKAVPKKPSYHELLAKGKKFPPKYLHESWQDYLYWDSPLEQN